MALLDRSADVMALLEIKCTHDGIIGSKCRRDGIVRHKVYTRWLLNRVFETLHWYVYVDCVALVRNKSTVSGMWLETPKLDLSWSVYELRYLGHPITLFVNCSYE